MHSCFLRSFLLVLHLQLCRAMHLGQEPWRSSVWDYFGWCFSGEFKNKIAASSYTKFRCLNWLRCSCELSLWNCLKIAIKPTWKLPLGRGSLRLIKCWVSCGRASFSTSFMGYLWWRLSFVETIHFQRRTKWKLFGFYFLLVFFSRWVFTSTLLPSYHVKESVFNILPTKRGFFTRIFHLKVFKLCTKSAKQK